MIGDREPAVRGVQMANIKEIKAQISQPATLVDTADEHLSRCHGKG